VEAPVVSDAVVLAGLVMIGLAAWLLLGWRGELLLFGAAVFVTGLALDRRGA
jgi:hypothetical protein